VAFIDITNRLVEILTSRVSTLVNDLDDKVLPICPRVPDEHFANQALFVYREGETELEYGHLANQGAGATTTGEIDGVGTWKITTLIRIPGSEDEASEQLARLAWNVLTVLRGYTKDTDNAWIGQLITGSTVDQAISTNGWYLRETFTLQIRWEMSF